MKSPNFKDRGFSLIEVLGTMLLSSMFLVLTLPYLTANTKLMKKVKSKENFELMSERVFQTISEATVTADSLKAIQSVTIHSPGRIETFDKQEAFVKQLAKYPIAKDNTPLSFMQLSKELPISVLSSNRSGINMHFIGCLHSAKENDISYRFYDDQHWLVISLDGISTMQGRLTKVGKTNLCPNGTPGQLNLTTLENPIFGDLLSPLVNNSTYLIYPIENEFSIYLDQKGTLRKFFHRTLVNQKLVMDIDSLNVATIVKRQFGSIFQVTISYKEQSKLKTFTTGSSQKSSPLDLIL